MKSVRKAKLVVKPKEKDRCPRYQPNSIPNNSFIRNRNTAGRLDAADKPKVAATKLPPKAIASAPIHTVKQTRPLSNDRLKVNTVVARDRSQTGRAKAYGTRV